MRTLTDGGPGCVGPIPAGSPWATLPFRLAAGLAYAAI